MEGFAPAPAVDLKIAVEGEDFRGLESGGQVNETRVGEVDFAVLVLAKDALDRGGGVAELQGDLESSRCDVLKNRFGGSGEPAEEIASLGDDGFAGQERCCKAVDDFDAVAVALLAAVEESNDDSGVEQDGFQRPKPLRCFLLEPRSGRPEENLPSPAMRGVAGAGWEAARRRIPSRTTFEGLQPRRRASWSRDFCASGSNRA